MQPESSSTFESAWTWLKHHHAKILALILTAQAAYALFTSLQFLFIRLPELEELFAAHLISQERINHLANRAIISGISTLISLFFALHLTTIQSAFMQKLGKVLAVLVVLGNTQLELILNQLRTSQLITTLIIEALRKLFS